VLLVADDPGGETLGEERSASSVADIVLAGVSAVRDVKGTGQVFGASIDDRVVMRSHEAVGVEPEPRARNCRLQQRDEQAAVVVGAEEHRLVHGARRDVEEPIRERRAKHPGHELEPTDAGRAHNLPRHFRPTSDTPTRASSGV
jgi:hypothetical protein